LTYNWQNQAIAVSQDVADSIIQNINPIIPITTILNGVNTENFRHNKLSGLKIRKELGIPESALVIGTIAVFRFQKRLIEWLDVFHRAKANNENLYGIIVGDGPLRKELESHWERLNLKGTVFFAGLQTEVKPWLSAIDIYMMTSEFEGLPVALLEAMSMQCAIASTDAGGIKEVVRDGKEGLLTTVLNWNNLSFLIDQYKDKDFRKKMGRNARLRVENDFSIKKMVSLLEDLYKEIYQNITDIGMKVTIDP
jgi:glycosyltransferase involved in cell wall biosynthesis